MRLNKKQQAIALVILMPALGVMTFLYCLALSAEAPTPFNTALSIAAGGMSGAIIAIGFYDAHRLWDEYKAEEADAE